MYIDGLTITGSIVVFIALGMFIRHCILKYCGSPSGRVEDCDDGTRHYKV